MVFNLENSNFNFPDTFYKFLIMLSPIASVLLFFVIFKTLFYICVRVKIRRKKLDINVLRLHYNLFLESNQVNKLLKNVNDISEIEYIIKKDKVVRYNPHNFDLDYDNVIDQNINYDGISIDSIDSIESNNQNEKCSICLSDIDNYIYTELHCSHKFHLKCLNEWVKNSNQCPLCKRVILEPV
jgi:hypothetical protein